MKKSVYSIVLMDDVVKAVDRAAYSMNTSRSNMINQILAEYCSFTTPEKRINDIFEYAKQMMSSEDHFQMQSSDAVLSVRSALRYKYNPVIRYSVELFRVSGSAIGQLRVYFRTQNQVLIEYLSEFFRFWNELENKNIGVHFKNGIPSSFDQSKYERQFMMPPEIKNQTNEQLAKAISDYIQNFDHALKNYFSNINDLSFAKKEIEMQYLAYLNTGSIII